MKSVSFDFDSTLSRKDVQEYAIELIQKGMEVWICTSRYTNERAHSVTWNDDLFKVAKRVGIPKDRIIFTNMIDKYVLINEHDFVWHLDDDVIEISLIRSYSKTVGVSVYKNNEWISKCNNLLEL